MNMVNNIRKNILRKGSKTNLLYDLNLKAYLNENGSLNYDRYKEVQTNGNKNKINNIWVIEQNIEFLSKYIKNKISTPKFGLCHGSRRGKEQEWFSKNLKCEVLGTEISDTALDFPNTIQWDFHEIKDEWIESVDFIYSNSFDHSFDPEKCINAWMKCLKTDGLCIIEHTDIHGVEGVSELDPFGAEIIIMPYLILKWGIGNFAVTEILSAPVNGNGVSYTYFLIIKKFV